MSREGPKDNWHTSRPGAQPCPLCRNASGQPTSKHGRPNRWAATWDEKVDGRRRQPSLSFRTRAEAEDVQRRMRNAVTDKSLPPGFRARRGVVTVAGWFPRFMEMTAPDRSASSNAKVRSQYARQVARLGDRDLAGLQHEPVTVRQWQQQLRADGYAAGTVDDAFRLLGAMFRYARGDASTGVIVNPCELPQARMRKADRRRAKREGSWTAGKVARAYLAPMPDRAARGSTPAWDRYRAAVLLAATCGGMRLGEVMALAPEDISWGNRTVTVRHSLARGEGGAAHFRDGKSDASRRVMTVAPLALKALAVHMERVRPATVTLPLETAECYGQPMETWPVVTRQLIFSTGTGGIVSDPAYQSAARYGLNRAGLLPPRETGPRYLRDDATGRYLANGGSQRSAPSQRYERPSDHGLHFHALRHFWVSLMLARGVPLTVIKDEVGHELTSTLRDDGRAGPDLTMDTYGHPVAGTERARWRRRIREIITGEFGPFLPDLLDAADAETARRA